MESRDQAKTKKAIHVWTHIRTLRKGTRNSSKIFEREFEERIYQEIRIIGRILDSLCIQEGRHISFMCRLSEVKQYHDQESLLTV